MSWPLALHLGDSAPVSVFTGGHLAALSVATHVPPWSVHTDLSGWPSGADFRPLLWPSIALAHLVGPLAAYDLTVLLVPVLNVLGGWALGRVIYGRGAAAVWLGALLALPPWVRTTLQNGQPEQAVLGVAAALLALALWAEGGPRWRAALLLPAFTLAGISAPHVTLAALAIVGVWAVASRTAWSKRIPVAASALLGGWLVSQYHGPGFDTSIAHFFAPFGLLDAHNGPQPKRAALLSDLFFRARTPPGKPPWVVHLAYLGPVLGLAALVNARRRPWAFAAGFVLLVLAFGDAGPFHLLTLLSPTLAASGTPYRFMLGVIVAFAAVVADSRWAPLVLAVSIAETLLVDPRPLPFALNPVSLDASSPALAAEGTGPVLDVPLVGRGCREAAAHYLTEAGRSGRPSPLLLRSSEDAWGDRQDHARALQEAFDAPNCAEVLPPLLTEYTAVVLHRHAGCPVREKTEACLSRVLGGPTVSGEVEWWTTEGE